MFGFLKEKLKSAVSVFSRKVEEEVEEKPAKKQIEKAHTKEEKTKIKKELKETKKEKKESKEPIKAEKPIKETKEKTHAKEIKEDKKAEEKEPKKTKEQEQKEELKEKPKEEKKGFFQKIFGKKEEAEETKQEEELEEEETKEVEEEAEEKKGFFKKVGEVFTTKTISDEKFDEMFFELEVSLMENNVAVSVIEKIKDDLKKELVNKKLNRYKIAETIEDSLKKSIQEIVNQDEIDVINSLKQKKPYVICFFGINGSGKTTSIAKFAKYLQKNKMSVVLAAADTFRAAAIDQIEKHGNNLGIKVIKQQYGADAAAVAFDAIAYAKAHSIDVVLIDTAGRTHANINLMDELKKIVKVSNPDLKVFVGDSLTGNDMVEQAEKYNEMIGVDAVILSKADVDEKGGAIISASYVLKKPILFMGVGQRYDDFKEFSKKEVLKNLGF